jgi:hypothetical protein
MSSSESTVLPMRVLSPGEELLGQPPLGGLAVDGAEVGAVAGGVADERAEIDPGEAAGA